MFWDIIGPLLLILFIGLVIWAIIGFLQKDIYPLLVGGVFELLICYMFGWSIGKLLLIIPIIQFALGALLIYRKIYFMRRRSTE